MGNARYDYPKDNHRASNRARQEADRKAAVDSRAKAIREKNRKIKAGQAQMNLRMILDAAKK